MDFAFILIEQLAFSIMSVIIDVFTSIVAGMFGVAG